MKRPVLIALAAVFFSAAAADAADIKLRFGTINAKTTRAFTEQLIPLKKAIEQGSQGKVEIELGGLNDFGKPGEIFGLLEKGQIEIASTVQGYHPGRFPLSSVMEMPMLFETAEAGTYAMWKLHEEGLLAKDYEGFKVLSLYVLPPYGIFTANIDFKSLRDLRGQRVRSPSLTVGLAMARLGMIPIGIPNNVVGTSLHENLIDSISYGWDSGATTPGVEGKFIIDQVKYLVDARFAAPALMIIMKQATYDGLPPEARKAIDAAAGLDFSLRSARMRDGWDSETRERLAKADTHKVIRLTAEQRAEMIKRTAPVVDEWTDTMAREGADGRKLLERARELIKQAPKA
jgi:TRAP-type C4-dicarboxylate transport system substrate-binding protein